MACCGKRKKNYDEHKKMLTRSSSRSAAVATSTPKVAGVRGSTSAQTGDSSRTIYLEKSGGTCPTCGSRTIMKRQYSERLRRYFNVAWCSTCKDAV
jgi:hypothetical protein